MFGLRMMIIAIALWFALYVLKRILSTKSTDIIDEYRGQMVTCSICDVYLPETDAISVGDGRFRCDRHQSG